MKHSLGISSFLEEISSLSVVFFFCFFALVTQEGFLISPYCFLELCIQMGIFFLSFLPFSSVLSLSHVQPFATPWTAAHQASLSITNSQSSL